MIAGYTVQLKWNGSVIASTTADASGAYEFDGLGNSSYEVCIVNDAGLQVTAPASGAGTGCGGSGYAFSFNSAFETWAMNNFGFYQP